LALSFDPDNGTGNVVSLSNKSTAPRNDMTAPPSERATLFRHGSGTRPSFQFEQSGSHRRWQPRLQ
jgi:hypothetical protein